MSLVIDWTQFISFLLFRPSLPTPVLQGCILGDRVGKGWCEHVLQHWFSLTQTSAHCSLYLVCGCGQPFHSAACSVVRHKHGACRVLLGARQLFGHFRDCILTWYCIHLNVQMQVSWPWGFIFLSCIRCCLFLPNLIYLFNFSNFYLIYYYYYLCVGSQDDQRTTLEISSLHPLWVPGIKLRLTGFCGMCIFVCLFACFDSVWCLFLPVEPSCWPLFYLLIFLQAFEWD